MSKATLASESGFGLIATIVAMVLLGVAVAALSSSGMMALAAQTDSSVRAAATSIAASYLEEVKARRPQTLTSESAIKVTADGMDEQTGAFTRTLEVEQEGELPYTKRVTVKVEYPNGMGRTGTIELVTIIYEGENRK